MIYSIDLVYQSALAYAVTLAPPTVPVVAGENYGIRLDDPTGKTPSIAVNMEDITDAALELGSAGASYVFSYTVNALSRFQRDALKSILFSGLMYSSFPIYDAYSPSFVPGSGAAQIGYVEVQRGVRIRDMPDFSNGRDRYFWTSVIFFTGTTFLV